MPNIRLEVSLRSHLAEFTVVGEEMQLYKGLLRKPKKSTCFTEILRKKDLTNNDKTGLIKNERIKLFIIPQ